MIQPVLHIVETRSAVDKARRLWFGDMAFMAEIRRIETLRTNDGYLVLLDVQGLPQHWPAWPADTFPPASMFPGTLPGLADAAIFVQRALAQFDLHAEQCRKGYQNDPNADAYDVAQPF